MAGTAKEDLLWSVSADQLAQLGLFIEIIFGFVTWCQAKSVGLAFLLLSGRSSIRLLMMRLWRACVTTWLAIARMVVLLVVMPAFVVIKSRALLEAIVIVGVVMETSTTMVATILLEAIVKMLGRTGHYRRSRRRISLVWGGRVWTATLVRSIWLWGIATAHWSTGIANWASVKTHPDGRAHGLRLGLVMMTSSTSPGTELLLLMGLGLRRLRRSVSTPL